MQLLDVLYGDVIKSEALWMKCLLNLLVAGWRSNAVGVDIISLHAVSHETAESIIVLADGIILWSSPAKVRPILEAQHITSMGRTWTDQRTTFHLPSPDEVTFSFQERDAMEICVPSDSKWYVPSHWHYKQRDARYLQVISGNLILSSSFSRTIGGSTESMNAYSQPYKFALDERISWQPYYSYDENHERFRQPLTAHLIANETLHRNICSMILDYRIFPELSSTPLWLKAVFWTLRSCPSAREGLLSRLLRVQRQLTLYAHDYHESHGRIPFSRMWFWVYPPPWTWRLEYISMMWISSAVGMACYWFGGLALGMSALYPEYTPVVEEGEKERSVLAD